MKRLLSLSLCIVGFTATAQQQIVTCQFPIEIEYEEEGLDLVWNTGDAGSSLLVNGPGHYSVSAITTNRLLDGTGQGFMEVQEISGYESDGHTAAVWVNPSSVSGVQDLISKDGECVERQWLLTLQNGAFMAHVWLDGGGSTQFATGNIALANEWIHVAQVWDGEILRLFINGQLYDAEPCIGTLVQGDEPLRIAGGAKYNCNAYESDCLFDDVAFWNRGLTEEEIGLVYAGQQEVFDDCLSRWTFEGDNPLFDSGVSGNQNSTNSLGFLDVNEEALIAEYEVIELDCAALASICGPGTLWDSEAQTCIVANPADINLDGCVQLNDLLDLLSAYGDCGAEEEASGFALSFDGVNDHVDFGNASLGNVEDVTFEVLMKTGSDSEGLGSNYQALLSKDCNGCEFSTGDWAILIGHNGNGVASFTINNSSGVAAVESGALNDEEWHWISVTRNATTGLVHLYVDGVEVDSDIGPVGLVHNEEKMYLAKYFLTSPSHYEGLIGEFRVWNRELTDIEIGTYLGAELQGNESGLVGLWNFSEGEGDVLTDQTNGGLNGQIIEATWTPATETP